MYGSATEVMLSLSGYEDGAILPASTTIGPFTQTMYVKSLQAMYISGEQEGFVHLTLRADASGMVSISSPAVGRWPVGVSSRASRVIASEMVFNGDIAFAAGTQIGISAMTYGAYGNVNLPTIDPLAVGAYYINLICGQN